MHHQAPTTFHYNGFWATNADIATPQIRDFFITSIYIKSMADTSNPAFNHTIQLYNGANLDPTKRLLISGNVVVSVQNAYSEIVFNNSTSPIRVPAGDSLSIASVVGATDSPTIGYNFSVSGYYL